MPGERNDATSAALGHSVFLTSPLNACSKLPRPEEHLTHTHTCAGSGNMLFLNRFRERGSEEEEEGRGKEEGEGVQRERREEKTVPGSGVRSDREYVVPRCLWAVGKDTKTSITIKAQSKTLTSESIRDNERCKENGNGLLSSQKPQGDSIQQNRQHRATVDVGSVMRTFSESCHEGQQCRGRPWRV